MSPILEIKIKLSHLLIYLSTAHLWKIHRKFLNPCFSPKLLQSFIPIFNNSSRRMVEYLTPHLVKGDEFDLYWNVGKCTLDMICATSMGSKDDLQGPDGDEFMKSAEP